ncbi:hypothetical protein R5R35_006355 [Gryllus longicercus]|uniref:Ribosomal RNA-processing protein 4 n=1 Tax=Gryllus longicercus TaxID=2509291 RepID=A0AAN9WML9_9ORTH
MPPTIRLASERVELRKVQDDNPPKIYTPGEVVHQGTDYLRGHGTYLDEDCVKSSVAGICQKINKWLIVRPIKKRYNGEVGDVVVGRISDLQMKRWRVDTNARLDSILLLSSVNLPTGELRRRSAEDEATMRKYLQEGDLICAEVQQVFNDHSLSLYTRSLKYGKLGQGTLVKVFPSLVKRQKTHFHDFPWGTSAILGNNGYIFIYPTSQRSGKEGDGYKEDAEETITLEERENIARVRNCIVALAHYKQMLYDTSIAVAFEESKKYEITQLLTPEVMAKIASVAQQSLLQHSRNH